LDIETVNRDAERPEYHIFAYIIQRLSAYGTYNVFSSICLYVPLVVR